jgi:ATP-binding cassette, subfamily B, bacterial
LLENIVYGNTPFLDKSSEYIQEQLDKYDLNHLFSSFENGLKTQMDSTRGTISLGQKQLIAFTRAILRQPKLLILDEATANIDTVTEAKLDIILDKLDKSVTKIIIAHRLNTIKEADQIFYVNAGNLTVLDDYQEALNMNK